MTETPETDLAEWGITPNDMVVRSGLARKLELECEELRKALSLAGRRCNQLHHPKSMQHGDSDPCPVEKFIEQVLWKQPK